MELLASATARRSASKARVAMEEMPLSRGGRAVFMGRCSGERGPQPGGHAFEALARRGAVGLGAQITVDQALAGADAGGPLVGPGI